MRLQIKVFGKVQGVFYRKTAKLKADGLGLVGWIRNKDDGSVEATVQGEKTKVEEFLKWSKKGPPFAKVDNVEADVREDEADLLDFSIIS